MNRQTYIGSSDAPAVAGLDPWKSRYQLHFEKTGEMPVDDISQKPEVKAGVALEPVVAMMFGRSMNVPVSHPQRFARHPTYGFLASHIDYLAGLLPSTKDGLEVKTTNPFRNDFDADRGTGWGLEMTDQVPDRVRVQCSHHMLCHGLDSVYVAVLMLPATAEMMVALASHLSANDFAQALLEGGADFRVYRVRRDEAVLQRHEEMCLKFWGAVQSGTAPPPDFRHPKAEEYMRRRARGEVGPRQAEGEDLKAINQLDELKGKIKSLREQETEAKARVLHALSRNNALHRADGSGYKLLQTKRGPQLRPANNIV